MYKRLYNIFSKTARLGLYMFSPFNKRLKKFSNSRKEHSTVPSLESSILFHCASLGEYEESKPLIDAIKKKYPHIPIVISFFSDSGYDYLINKTDHHVVYLPFDKFGGYDNFLNQLHPILVIISKYEFWYGLLADLEKKDIPVLHINTVINNNSSLFKWPRLALKEVLHSVEHFYTSDNNTKKVLHDNNITHATTSKDLRLIRANELRESPYDGDEFEKIQKPIIIFGSTWPEDEKWIIPFIKKYKKLYHIVLAPHDISKTHIQQLLSALPSAKLMSNGNLGDITIVDSIGQLKYIYRYAVIAYVGGGIHNKIHNYLEASAYLIPVVIGPNHKNMPVAQAMIEEGFIKEVQNIEELENALISFRFKRRDKQKLKKYFESAESELHIIMSKIEQLVNRNIKDKKSLNKN